MLMIPGWTNSSPDHWQSRWEGRLKGARRVAMPDFDRPVRDAWVGAISAAVEAAERPAVLIAHGCGVLAAVHAANSIGGGRVVGAMLAAPPDLGEDGPIAAFVATSGAGVERPHGFDPLPLTALPFPSVLFAGRDDPFCSFYKASEYAAAWGSRLIDAGAAGHINASAGFGPWPEGAMGLATFLKSL